MFKRIIFLFVCACMQLYAYSQSQVYTGYIHARESIEIIMPPGTAYINAHLKIKNVNGDGLDVFLQDKQHKKILLKNGLYSSIFSTVLPAYSTTLILRSHNTDTVYSLELKQEEIIGYQQPGKEENDIPNSQIIQQLQNELKQYSQQIDTVKQQFWKKVVQRGGTPIVEVISKDKSLVTFLWEGAKHNVRLIGGPSNDHIWLKPITHTDIWYKSFLVDNHLRLSYRLAPDVPQLPELADKKENFFKQRRALLSVIQADPLNPKLMGDDSLLELNQAPKFIPTNSLYQGVLHSYSFSSKVLNNNRRIWIYQTTADNELEPVVLYLFDGQEYLQKVNIPTILDALSEQMKRPICAVLIGHVDSNSRSIELPLNKKFAEMMALELVPFVQQKVRLVHNPKYTVIAGSSYGGLAAAYIATQYPKVFTNVVSLSGSFWWHHPHDQQLSLGLAHYIQQHPVDGIHWFISAGIYERASAVKEPNIYETSLELSQILKKQKQIVFWKEYIGGHDYAIWKGALVDGILRLFTIENNTIE